MRQFCLLSWPHRLKPTAGVSEHDFHPPGRTVIGATPIQRRRKSRSVYVETWLVSVTWLMLELCEGKREGLQYWGTEQKFPLWNTLALSTEQAQALRWLLIQPKQQVALRVPPWVQTGMRQASSHFRVTGIIPSCVQAQWVLGCWLWAQGPNDLT